MKTTTSNVIYAVFIIGLIASHASRNWKVEEDRSSIVAGATPGRQDQGNSPAPESGHSDGSGEAEKPATVLPIQNTLPAGCDIASVAENKEDPYAYLTAVIDSLGAAKTERPLKLNAVSLKDIDEFLVNAKLSSRDLKCASEIVEPFAKSKDTVIAKTAEALRMRYDLIRLVADKGIVAFENFLSSTEAPNPGQHLKDSTDARVAAKEGWDDLPVTIALASFAVRDKEPKQLRITSEQRLRLLRLIEERFGRALKLPTKQQHSTVVSASLLRRFLSDKTWQSRKPH